MLLRDTSFEGDPPKGLFSVSRSLWNATGLTAFVVGCVNLQSQRSEPGFFPWTEKTRLSSAAMLRGPHSRLQNLESPRGFTLPISDLFSAATRYRRSFTPCTSLRYVRRRLSFRACRSLCGTPSYERDTDRPGWTICISCSRESAPGRVRCSPGAFRPSLRWLPGWSRAP